jgi:Fic family protein
LFGADLKSIFPFLCNFLGLSSGNKRYIWLQDTWPQWAYSHTRLAPLLTQVHHAQGLLLGRMHDFGLAQHDQAILRALTEYVIKTSEIEGEMLNPESMRSSIARRLGVDIGALAPTDRHVDGLVDIVLGTTQQHDQALTVQRL